MLLLFEKIIINKYLNYNKSVMTNTIIKLNLNPIPKTIDFVPMLGKIFIAE